MATKNFNLAKLARNINIQNDGSIAFSSEVSAGTGGETIGSLTASMDSNQTTTINFTTTSTPVPIVQAYKEVPQAGISAKGQWDVNANATNYDFYDEKPISYASSTLTPSATGDGTFTSSNPITSVFDLSSSSAYTNVFTPTRQQTSIGGATQIWYLKFKSDGTKMYHFSPQEDSYYQYSLGTAWDLSTATYEAEWDMTAISGFEFPGGMAWKSDGTKIYWYGRTGRSIRQHTLTTAWDISTVSNTIEATSVSSPWSNQSGTIYGGLTISPDGTKWYSGGANTSNYDTEIATFATAWDITSSITNSSSSNLAGTVEAIDFNSDGTQYLESQTDGVVRRYTLSTAYDLTTRGAATQTIDLTTFLASFTTIRSMTVSADRTKLYVGSDSVYKILEIDIGASLAFNAADVGKKVVGNSGSAIITSTAGAYKSVTAFADTSAISSWQLFSAQGKADGSGIELSGYTSGYDLSSPSNVKSWATAASPAENIGSAMLGSDGTKGFYLDTGNNQVVYITLSTAFDISTATRQGSFNTQSSDAARGLYIFGDGTRIYTTSPADYVRRYDLSTAWDISTVTYTNNFYQAAQEASMNGLEFKPDGTKMYVCGTQNNTAYQYSLSTAWDITTASYDSKSLSVNDLGTSAMDLRFNSNGTKLFVMRNSGQILTYNLSTPWDISTGSYSSGETWVTGYTNVWGFSFANNGTKILISNYGANPDELVMYDTGSILHPYSTYSPALTDSSTGQINSSTWTDINSMTADETKNGGDIFYAVSTDNRTSWGVAKASDGVRKIARNNSGTWQYNNNAGTSTAVSTGFDLTNVTYDNKSFNFTLTGSMGGIEFKPDGTKLYVSDASSTTNGIRQYNLSTAWDISTAVHYGTGNPQSIANHIRISDDGTQVYYLSQSNDYLYSDILSTPWDITTISYNAGTSKAKLLSISISGLTENSPQGFDFADNGSKLYMVGQTNQYIYEWSLSTPWDISTASIGASDWHNISSQDQLPEELVVSADGTKILVSGNGNDKVFEYVMSTAFDITTATYTNRSMGITDSGAAGYNPTGLALSADGMKLYYATSLEYVFQYSISGSVNVVGYGTSETWVNGTNNNEHATLQQALGAQSFNRMNKAQLDAIADANHFSQDSADTLDLMIAPYAASGTSPVSDGVTINYDAASKYRQAVPETDYRADFVGNNKLEFTSNISANFKVKVL